MFINGESQPVNLGKYCNGHHASITVNLFDFTSMFKMFILNSSMIINFYSSKLGNLNSTVQ